MGRRRGATNKSGNYEVNYSGPLDARQKVDLLEDLYTLDTWLGEDGQDYSFVGMLSVVTNDNEENNGLYRLLDKTSSDINEWLWKKIDNYEDYSIYVKEIIY